MKKILLFLLLTATAGAQVPGPGFAFWKSGSAPSFSPADIDSLKGWYVAADLADSLAKSDGDTTYIFPNRAKWYSPHVFDDAYQTTDANKPLYRDSTWAKHVWFDGVNDNILSPATVEYTQPTTYFMVFRGYRPQGSDRFLDGNAVNKRHILYINGGSGLEYVAAPGGVAGGIDRILSPDSTYIAAIQFNGASSFIRINGMQYANTDQGTATMAGISFGTRQNATFNFLLGGIAEFVAYHSAITSGNIESVESYLATKYGITLAP